MRWLLASRVSKGGWARGKAEATKTPSGWHTSILVPEIERSALVVGSAADVAHDDELSAAAVGRGCRRRESSSRRRQTRGRAVIVERRGLTKIEEKQPSRVVCGARRCKLQGARIKGNAGGAGLTQSGTAATAVIWRGGRAGRHNEGGRVAMSKRDAGRDEQLMEQANLGG